MNEAVKKWVGRITAAEKKYETYYTLIDEVREYYKNDGKGTRQSIFWSSIETLKPFLYFKQPKPYVDCRNKNGSQVEKIACKILEKALVWDLEQFDFDGAIKYARNDFLLCGTGLAWEKYAPEFEDFKNGEEVVSIKTSEKVETVYIDPKKFLFDVENVGVWEDVDWVARRIDMTRAEAKESFGETAVKFLSDPSDKESDKKEVKIYEVWDKKSKKVYWLAKEVTDEFLRETEDPLEVDGFFPVPKPIFATLTNDSLIPVPDFTMIKDKLDELSGVNSRMKLTMQALKVSGAYDNSFPELANILNKDVTLVAAKDFQRLKESGGLRGIIDFVPIEQYIAALESLATRRQDIMGQIYEVTGVSDIMRGNSNPNDTATAVSKKTNFGTLRNQDRQNDMQRFITDLLKIKAEIICEQFSADTLANFLSVDEAQDKNAVMDAINLLKTDKLRGLVLGIETDTAFNQDAEAQKVVDAVKTINEMISVALPAVSQQPLLLPLYQKMAQSVVMRLPDTRQFVSIVDKVFEDIAQSLAQPQQPAPQNPIITIQSQKNAQEFEIKKEQNALKAQEIEIKRQAEQTKAALTEKEMDMQGILKAREIEEKGGTNPNITTGFVKAF